MRYNKFINWVIFLVLYFLNFSPFFNESKYLKFFVFLAIIFLWFRNKKIKVQLAFVLIIVELLIIIQGSRYGNSIITMTTYPFFVIIVPYYIFTNYKDVFFKNFIILIHFFSIFTLIIWLLETFISSFKSLIYFLIHLVYPYSTDVWPRSLIIFTSVQAISRDLYRNAGIAHEPGAWAYFLIMAIVLNNIINKEYFSKKNIAMMIAVITTFSTAGYIILLSVIALWLFSMKSKSNTMAIAKILFIPIFAFSIFISYNTFDFLGEKINNQIEVQLEGGLENRASQGRFIRFRKGINVAIKNPIWGRGIISATGELDNLSAEHIPNGYLTGIIAQYGFIFGFLYFFYLFKGSIAFSRIFKVNDLRKYSLFFVIILNGMSQSFIYDWFAVIIFFYGISQKNIYTDYYSD